MTMPIDKPPGAVAHMSSDRFDQTEKQFGTHSTVKFCVASGSARMRDSAATPETASSCEVFDNLWEDSLSYLKRSMINWESVYE